jgi:3',5'-cyclic AMP phosphodiesterase CpdA
MSGPRTRRMRILIVFVLTAAATLAGCTATSEPEPVDPAPSASASNPPSPSAPPPTLRFTASGDFSASPATGAVLADVAGSGSGLHLALGDLSYGRAGEEARWCDFVTDRVGEEFPFQLLAGNHESDGRNGHIDEFARCLPNRLPGLAGEYGRRYFVDVPEPDPLVRLILISPGVPFDDGVDEYRAGSEQYEWTASAIDEARDAGIPWVVVGMHMPCLTVGRYGCGAGADVLNLLVEKRVDLVMSGHEHNYQRTHLIATGDGCGRIRPDRFDDDCVADRDGTFQRGDGTVFVIAGTSGVELRDINRFDAEWGYMAAAAGFNETPAWGSLEVQLTPDRLTGAFRRAIGDMFADSFTVNSPDAVSDGR